MSRSYRVRFSLVHIGGSSLQQAASLESQPLATTQHLFGRTLRAIKIDITDLDSVFKAKEEINNQINTIDDGEDPIDSPISIAFDMQKLRESGSSSDRIQADIIQNQAEMQNSLRRLEDLLASVLDRKHRLGESFRASEMLGASLSKDLEKEVFPLYISNLDKGEDNNTRSELSKIFLESYLNHIKNKKD